MVSDESGKQNIASSEWIVIRNSEYNPEFLAWYFRTPKFQKFMTSEITGIGGSLTRAQPKCVAEYPVPVLNRKKQDEIVNILDKCKLVIDSRKRELLELDNIIKARFVELFGDPRSNPFGFEKKMLKDTCKVITGNTPSRAIAEYYGDYIEWIKTDNIVSGILNPTQATESLSEKGMNVGRTVEKDSILMACIAGSIASIGRVCITDRIVAFNQGIVYDELSEADKEIYENTFEDENGKLPEAINSAALNTWIFNEDTIKKVLHVLMRDGIKIEYGQKIGKTIIFAKNHDHAEKILEIFNKEYPHLKNYAMVIDNRMKYAQSAIDEFSDPKKLPQIAISVDMLDTGIDVPEVLNLVFFKKVMSKAKFWQMIGRGTRLCPGLLDGEDKKKFYIFDFCGNFEFFRMNKGKASANLMALQSAVFNLQFEISYKLQDIKYQTDKLTAYRTALVKHMTEKIKELPRDSFTVRQHLKYVELYSEESNYQMLTYEDTLLVREEVAPLILPESDEVTAVRFDALMYGIELASLVGKKYTSARKDLLKKVSGIAGVANIPEIQAQTELIDQILHTDYVENAGIDEFENIRKNLRDLMKYIPDKSRNKYMTNFTDEILSTEWKEAELENNDLENYKVRVEYYVRQHQDNYVISKLKKNQPLTEKDVDELEKILWRELGTKEDYEAEFGRKPLGEFVREMVGLDMNAAKEAFSKYLEDVNLDSRQIYFVNQIIEYIVHNGMMKDLSVLLESPFTDRGGISEIFTDMGVWLGIKKVIDTINANAAA